jgi:hypothetical protein
MSPRQMIEWLTLAQDVASLVLLCLLWRSIRNSGG